MEIQKRSSPKQPVALISQISLAIHNLNRNAEKHFGMSIVQCHILKQLLEMPGASAQELARAAGIHPSTLTPSLRRLERKRFLFMGEDPRDSRKRLISITRAGAEALGRAEEKIASLFKGIHTHQYSLEGLTRFLATRLTASRSGSGAIPRSR